jgi:hypothetical protein
MGVVEVSGQSYHMNDNLIKKWNNLKSGKLKKIDKDRAYVVDGRERSGKSLFTVQQSAEIDEEVIEDQKDGVVLPRIPMGNAKSWEDNSEWRTKVIIDDEAFRGMSSKSVLSKENKKLGQAMMEMGQNNLVLFIVSPSFFLLELYPAVLRTNALFHIKEDKNSGKRIVRIFNFRKKAMLYQIGIRKGWGYNIKTKMNANFYNIYPGGKDFEWRYRLKKQLSLREIEVKEEKEEDKWKVERDLMIKGLYSEINSFRKLSKKLKEWGVNLSHVQLSFLVKGKDKNKKEDINDDKIEEELDDKDIDDDFSDED